MCRSFRWSLPILFACTAASVHGAPPLSAGSHEGRRQTAAQNPQQSPRRSGGSEHPRIKWWEDPAWRGELGITDRQSGKIRDIFEVEMVKLRAMREEMNKLEAALAQMVKEERASLASLTEKWDRVGSLLSEMYKTRQLMIYRIDRELTPQQRVKLQAMFEKLQAERRQSEPKGRR